MEKIVLLFGASSGIGLASAKIFLEQGCQVINCSRHPAPDSRIKNYQVDTAHCATIDTAVKEIENSFGRIDIMIYCSGTSMAAPIDKVLQTDYKYLFDVNLLGAIYATQKVINVMKKQCSGGRIVLIGSLASVAPIPYDPYYCASKAALNAFTVALATEIERYGISICNVLPGGTKTGFSFVRKVYEANDDNLVKASQALAKQEQNGMTAESVAKRVYKSATAKHPPLIAVAGVKNKIFYFSCKLMPVKLLKRAIQTIFNIKK